MTGRDRTNADLWDCAHFGSHFTTPAETSNTNTSGRGGRVELTDKVGHDVCVLVRLGGRAEKGGHF